MPAEPDDPVVLVPLEPTDGGSARVESRRGADRPRKRWWLAAAVAVVLLVAAVLVSSQLGSETPDDSAEVAEDRPDPNAGDSPPEQTEVTEAPPADSAPTEQTDPDPAGDESTDDEDDQSAELSQAFGEPEHPVSGVEPYIPRRVRLDEPGPPADVCRGVLPALRIQLPLRFASTKPEGVDQLSWSPDCRRIVFRVGSTLWVADGDGTSDMPFLTAQHGLSSPSWSPDGEQIAFSQGAIVDGERASHVYVVQPDALGLRQITDGLVLDQEPAWSPDGTRIAFSRRARVPQVTGTSDTADTDDTGGTGDAVGFDQHLVVIELATGTEQVLTAGGEHDSGPSWSPDGGAIAYRVGGELRDVRLDALSHSRLLVGVVGGRGSWSPDGSRVAAWRDWWGGRATIVVLDRPGLYPGDQHVIALEGPERTSPSMAPTLQWSADGRHLFFHGFDTPAIHWAYSIAVPRPARSAEYWAMLDVVETVVREAGYDTVSSQHSVAVEAEFSIRGRSAQGVIEVWIAFERSEPRRFFDAIENPHSELPGISRSPQQIGVWFECDGVYGEVLAVSQADADALAANLMPAACATR